MEVDRLVEETILSISEKISKVLEHDISFQEFQAQLKKELDQYGDNLLKVIQESPDQLLHYYITKKAELDDSKEK
ncbi:MAG: hypothetical protein PHN71_08560 [Candidatus Cloacimonetes bacterium]|nr:hypothetical protein [Candidatus Cloacimonadota bacterium]MDD4079254.1 hypothetical protein [Eubacteriales bacterium]MDD4769430.1 hypothetical protein [Eubacteriales bacterium]